ncbi:hypothetical protein, partial [uncultured Desulfovibrio sp.]|uniref:hypothetical protein n=1 Tax=uncultured Desulfovibrio sp. TaxID=167968 RepID=UPI00260D5E2A
WPPAMPSLPRARGAGTASARPARLCRDGSHVSLQQRTSRMFPLSAKMIFQFHLHVIHIYLVKIQQKGDVFRENDVFSDRA